MIFPNKFYRQIKVPTIFFDIKDDETCKSFDCDSDVKNNKFLSHF